VYAATSAWAHFSPDHLRAAWRITEHEIELRLEGGIPARPEMIGPAPMRELLLAIVRATEEIFSYVEAWESRKGLPLGESRST